MKRLAAISSVFLLSLVLGASDRLADPVTVRVLTYNIRHGEGTDGRLDLVRQAEIMRSVRPDIIALQEVDQGTDRAGGVNQLDELARLLDMHAEFGRAIDYRGGHYGVAVLSRWPLESPDNQALPSSPLAEQRTALTVNVRIGHDGPLLRVTSTHFDSSRDAADRLAQATRLNELLASSDGIPTILAGDFNARPDTDVMAILHAHWTNAVAALFTPPPGDQGQGQGQGQRRRGPRNDYVLYRPAEQWRLIESQIVDAPGASDHRPVLSVLEWIGPS